jgi:hypothetical protein
VHFTYCDWLHRVAAADHVLLRSDPPGAKAESPHQRVAGAAAAYGVPNREFTYVNAIRNHTRRLWRVKEAARRLTAARYHLEQSQVQRILAARAIKLGNLLRE